MKTRLYLVQKRPLIAEYRSFEVVRDRYVVAKFRSLFRSGAYYVDLPLVNPSPEYQRFIPWRWIQGSAAAALPALIFGLWGVAMGIGLGAVIFLVTLFSLICLALAGVAAYRWRNDVVIYSRFSHTPLFRLFANRPSRREFRKFLGDLRAAVTTATNQAEQRSRKQKMLRFSEIQRLRREGMITERQYQQLLSEYEATVEDTMNNILRDLRMLKAEEIRTLRRLDSEGILGEEDYEAGKRRILSSFE
ncbi:MAG TPA: hypothetical protein VFA95_06210 [Gammaproteobacteria bacterium]|nr:hypothetical protein [Gammaproteobacteria bacterium]